LGSLKQQATAKDKLVLSGFKTNVEKKIYELDNWAKKQLEELHSKIKTIEPIKNPPVEELKDI